MSRVLVLSVRLKERQRTLNLLNRGEDPNEPDTNGITPLKMAAWNGDVDMVLLLMSFGAKIVTEENVHKLQDDALHAAAATHSLPVVAAFLDSGADINRRGRQDRTPLMIATMGMGPYLAPETEEQQKQQQAQLSLVAYLVEKGADVNLQDIFGRTALFFCSVKPMLTACLCKANADVDRQDEAKDTALIESCRFGSYANIRQLLQGGANPNLSNRSGFTALMCAACSGWLDVVRLLLEHDADRYRTDARARTAFDWATMPKTEYDLLLPSEEQEKPWTYYVPGRFGSEELRAETAKLLLPANASQP